MLKLPRVCTGVTLAELLVALLILAEISTFAIPKILTTQQSQLYKARTKQVIAMISQAYFEYLQDNSAIEVNFTGLYLTPYMNYVTAQSTTLDNTYGLAENCGGGTCYALHSGGVLRPRACGFGGTGSTNAVVFMYDADGTQNTTGNTVGIYLYRNGRITTEENIVAGTVDSCLTAVQKADPGWFDF